MIKAVIFDFGQTLVDSATGFRKAEKDAQAKIFSNLGLSLREDFLKNYRRFRKELHEQSVFSRMTLWKKVYFYYSQESDLSLLETWEREYWMTVRAHTTLFPKSRAGFKIPGRKIQGRPYHQHPGSTGIRDPSHAHVPGTGAVFEIVIVAGEGEYPRNPTLNRSVFVWKICSFYLENRYMSATTGESISVGLRMPDCTLSG